MEIKEFLQGLPPSIVDSGDIKSIKAAVNQYWPFYVAGVVGGRGRKNTQPVLLHLYNQVAQKYGYRNWQDLTLGVNKPTIDLPEVEIEDAERASGLGKRWSQLSFDIPSLRDIKKSDLLDIRSLILSADQELPAEEKLPQIFWSQDSPVSMVFEGGAKLRITAIGTEGCQLLSEYQNILLDIIKTKYNAANIGKRIRKAPRSFHPIKGDKVVSYCVHNMALTEVSTTRRSIKDVKDCAYRFIYSGLSLTESLINPNRKISDWKLDVQITSLSRPMKNILRNGESIVVLPKVTFSANIQVTGPCYVGEMTHLGYGSINTWMSKIESSADFHE